MESKNIIIILIVIIVILAAAIGFMVLKPMHAKEPTKIKVDSNKTLYEGENLSVKLTDLNKTPLKAKLDLNLKKGKYDVSVSYGGNENYTGNNTTQKLTIKEKVKETVSESNTGQSSKPPRTEYTGDPNDREAYAEWRRQDLQSENPHRGYSLALDGPENSPVK